RYHLGGGLVEGDALLHACQHPEPVAPAIGFPFRRVHGYGRPELRIAHPNAREPQILGHDARHVIGLAIHRDFVSHDVLLSSEGALPQSVAQDDHVIVAARPLVWRKAPSELRLRTKKLKRVGRNRQTTELQWLAGTGERRAGAGDGGHTLKTMVHRLP